MKNKLTLLLLILAVLAIPASAQISGGTAYRVISGNSLPATCDPGPETTDVFVKTSATVGLYYCSATNTWTAVGGGGGGTGDVVGPSSATDNAVARFDTTTGKLIQNSVVLIGDTGNVTGLGTLNTHTIPGGTDTFAMLAATQTLSNKTFVAPVLGAATGTSLTLTGDAQVGIAALYKFGGSNSLSYTDSTGPKFTDGNTTRDLIFNVQSLSANRTVTWPDASGTVAFTSGVPAGANPSASVGLTAVNGVATTFLRSDGAPALDQGITPTWTGAHIFTNTIALTSTTATNNKITQGAAINIGTTSTDGIILQNTTAAAAGAQQYSPRLRFKGSGWKTNATAAAQDVEWIMEVQPVQGATAPTANLLLSGQINGGGFNQAIAAGQILGPGGGSASQSLPQYSSVNNTQNGLLIGGGNAGNGVSIRVNGTAVFTADANVGTSIAGIPVNLDFLATPNSHTGRQVRLTSPANAVLRLGDNNGTGAGSFILGTSTVGSVGTSGVGLLVIANGTAPTSSPADEFQLYSADSAAGDANAFARNEAGEVNRLTGLAARNSSAFTATSSTTLTNITGLTRNVEAGRTYAFSAVLQTTAVATGGVKLAVSGTATATAISYVGVLEDGTSIVANTRATALDTAVCAVTTSTAGTCKIDGVIQVNAAGTLTIQFAQNASDGSASTVLANQSLRLIPIS